MAHGSRLPPELLCQVIESVLPSNPDELLPASHVSTKTLLALTRVSRVTYALATKLLRQRCLYIDSSRRLATVVLCLSRFVPTLPPVLSLRNVTSLYLAPFEDSLNDQPTAKHVQALFYEVSDSLTRLVVHMPFKSLDPVDDHLSIRRTLREGFAHLHQLEEFVSVGEYPALSVSDGPTDVWRLWPDLKRLTLFGAPADSHWLWWDIATLGKLQHVVLVESLHLELVNIKDEYFHKLPREDPRLARDITIVLLDGMWVLPGSRRDRWDEIDPEGKMTVRKRCLRLPDASDLLRNGVAGGELLTQFVKRRALDGTLWSWTDDVEPPSYNGVGWVIDQA
ncbi:hypothetical protein G7046_g1936 [Stylonectria norvegica]|nr:hypothetical protein G7046_g1936 [Stylonectria norvegica]